MPDPVLGEKACLFAVIKSGQTLTLNELNNFLVNERKIAKFKLPERLEIVDQLPVTHVGKINKREIRKIIADKLSKRTT
jgi:non-ribosomal peptide synthetase component E (peptide arylation enzyme)